MAYDEELAGRVRGLLAGQAGLEERRMLGGLAFLLGGHLAVAASGQGGLMVRVDPAGARDLTARPGVTPMEMRGRGSRAGAAAPAPRPQPASVLFAGAEARPR